MSGKVGRPSKLTEETKEKLKQALIAGCTIADACVYADISHETLSNWNDKAMADKGAGRQSDYVAFLEDITRAKDMAKPRLIMLLSKAAERDPRTTLAILERRYPDEWGARYKFESKSDTRVRGEVNVIDINQLLADPRTAEAAIAILNAYPDDEGLPDEPGGACQSKKVEKGQAPDGA